jgi:hypothetical protein
MVDVHVEPRIADEIKPHPEQHLVELFGVLYEQVDIPVASQRWIRVMSSNFGPLENHQRAVVNGPDPLDHQRCGQAGNGREAHFGDEVFRHRSTELAKALSRQDFEPMTPEIVKARSPVDERVDRLPETRTSKACSGRHEANRATKDYFWHHAFCDPAYSPNKPLQT